MLHEGFDRLRANGSEEQTVVNISNGRPSGACQRSELGAISIHLLAEQL
jgi:hypothetical protein